MSGKATLGVIFSRQRTTKALIRLRESCSDIVGYGNSLSNVLTFLLSYTKLITLTALELAIGFLEGFCYLLF